jgi:hypothetical protein
MFASAVVVATLAGAWGGATALASASPIDEPSDAVGCQLDLSFPQLVALPGGGKAIRAALDPATCAAPAQPTDVRVCLSAPNGQGDCTKTPGWSLAQVFVPVTSTGIYTATGQICWQEILTSFVPGCRSATLSSTF